MHNSEAPLRQLPHPAYGLVMLGDQLVVPGSGDVLVLDQESLVLGNDLVVLGRQSLDELQRARLVTSFKELLGLVAKGFIRQ